MSPHVLCFFGDMSYFLVWLQGTNCVCWTISLMSACWGSKCPPAAKAKLKEIQEAQKRGDLICVVGDVCSLVVWFQTESCVHIMLITLLIQSTIKYPAGFYNGKLVLWLGQCLGDGTKNQKDFDELFNMFISCGENWLQSDLVMKSVSTAEHSHCGTWSLMSRKDSHFKSVKQSIDWMPLTSNLVHISWKCI